LLGVAALSGNMVVAMCMASPRMFCRSAARESIESLPPSSGSLGPLVYGGLEGLCRLFSIALAVVIASEAGECESISACDFHAARVCGVIGYLNVGTLGVLAVVTIGLAGRMCRCVTFPRTPLWSRNDAAIVWVGSLWVERPSGSHMEMWSMHEAWSGFDGGRNVGIGGPSHLS
jgi:hypothetical protein